MRAAFFSFLFLISSTLCSKTVYFVPIIGYDEQKLFYDPYSHRDQIAKPFCRLREEIEKLGYEVKFTHDCVGLEDVAAIISFEGDPTVTRNIKQYPRERCFLICFDPPVSTPWVYESIIPDRYQKVFVMMDDLIDNANYFKLHYPQPHFDLIKDIPSFSQKKFCVMISGNHGYHNAAHPSALYNERKNVVLFFEHLYRDLGIDEFDLFGRGWDYWLLWKGAVWDKLEVFKNYKFAICYENMHNQVGYITEKIFDCFLGGCVPVYLGADNIADYVPKECFIDRREFSSDQALYDFLKSIDEKTYDGYMQAIRDYLKSDRLKPFTVDHFVDMVLQELAKLPDAVEAIPKSVAPQTAISYDFSWGRFGDNLLSYLHAKWFSYKYNVPLLYRPFDYGAELALSEKELSYDLHANNFDTVTYLSDNCPKPVFPGLFICPYFPEIKWELNRNHFFYEKVDWKDKNFRGLIHELVAPKGDLALSLPPEEMVSIAVHIREGGGFDDEEHKLKHPLKTPPFTFYVDCLSKIIDLFPGKPLYCHIFTDAADPQWIVEKIQRSLPQDAPIAFHFRKENNLHNLNVLEDFFSLFQYDILIRTESNYSIIPSLIHDYAIVFAPETYSIHYANEVPYTPAIHPVCGKVVTIDEIGMERNEDLYEKCRMKPAACNSKNLGS